MTTIQKTQILNRFKSALNSTMTWLVVPIVVTLLWWVAAETMNSAVFPNPYEAVTGLFVDFGRAEYLNSIALTMTLLLLGWLLAAVVGTLLGFSLGLAKFWSRVFTVPLYALYSTPKIALYPIFLIFLGIGETSRLAFGFVHALLPMTLMVMGATQAINKNLLTLSDSLVLSWPQKFRKILFPAIVPTIVTALRITFGLTLMGLILAGMFSGKSGLGYELVSNIAYVRVDRIAGQVMFIVLIAIIPGLLLKWMENSIVNRYRSTVSGV